MTSVLPLLHTYQLQKLKVEVAEGRLQPPFTALGFRDFLPDKSAGEVAKELQSFLDDGNSLSGLLCSLEWLLESRLTMKAQRPKTELVWTGEQNPEQPIRDTAVVVKELFQRAKQSILLSSYSFDSSIKTRALFTPLAQRMEEVEGLEVLFFLNIQRKWGDVTESEILVKQFSRQFREEWWPGSTLPQVYYDPRALERTSGSSRACLHAKCILVDEQYLFLTSANFSEAAHERNIEAGLLLDDSRQAKQLSLQYTYLREEGKFVPLFSDEEGEVTP